MGQPGKWAREAHMGAAALAGGGGAPLGPRGWGRKEGKGEVERKGDS